MVNIPKRETILEIAHQEEPALYLRETEQANPAGLWRFRLNGDVMYLEKATGVDFSSYDSSAIMGSLGASAFVVASNAYATTLNFAKMLQHLGYPVWVCDGTADDVQIQAAIDAMNTAGGGNVCVSEGTYWQTSKVTIKKNVSLILSDAAVLIPVSSIDIIELDVLAALKGGTIDVTGLGEGGYTSSAILLQGSSGFGINNSHRSKYVSDVTLLAFETGSTPCGTAINMDAPGASENLLFTVWDNIRILGKWDTVLKMTASGAGSVVSAHIFSNFHIHSPDKVVVQQGTASWNRFDNWTIECTSVVSTGFTMTGNSNLIKADFIDWTGITHTLSFAAGSNQNIAIGSFATNNEISNSGTDNTILNSAYGRMQFGGDVFIEQPDGIDVKPGSDTDADLITVGVTDTPRIWWDESEDAFLFTKGGQFTGNVICRAGLFLGDAQAFGTLNSDDDYVVIQARDNTVGRIEVARMQGAAEPSFYLTRGAFPVDSSDYEADWSTYSPAPNLEGHIRLAHNTNGAGSDRMYYYANAGWHYIVPDG